MTPIGENKFCNKKVFFEGAKNTTVCVQKDKSAKCGFPFCIFATQFIVCHKYNVEITIFFSSQRRVPDLEAFGETASHRTGVAQIRGIIKVYLSFTQKRIKDFLKIVINDSE